MSELATRMHIESPWWFLLPVIGLLLFRLTPDHGLPGAWPSLVRHSLQGLLMDWLRREKTQSTRLWRWLICLLLGVALAGIRVGTHETAPLRNLHARYLVVDTTDSKAMSALQFVARELAARAVDIPTGVIAVAADAYDVVPITTDVGQLDRYLTVLDPAVMPSAGRRPGAGLTRAQTAMARAGIGAGQIVLLSAGAPPTDDVATQMQYPVWFVTASQANTAWSDYASAAGATLLTPSQINELEAAMVSARRRVDLQATPVSERRELAPWLALVCIPLWLLVFFRSYKV